MPDATSRPLANDSPGFVSASQQSVPKRLPGVDQCKGAILAAPCSMEKTPGAVQLVPDSESQVWQCVSKRSACTTRVQRAACKLLIRATIGNQQLDHGCNNAVH